MLFSVYTANFASFGETYGSLGTVIVVMLWLMITATVIIMGAEINAVIESHAMGEVAEDAPTPSDSHDAAP